MVQLRFLLLSLPLLQEPMAVLIDGLHHIGKNHSSGHSGRHLRAAMQDPPVVHHNHGMLRPLEGTLESGFLAQRHPSLVGIHVRLIGFKRKGRDATFCLGLHNLEHAAIFVEGEDWVCVHQFKAEALCM